MLQPVVRRTWAPKGKTPIEYSWDRRDRLSAISAISVSPKHHRLGLHFSVQDSNIRMDDFEKFVAQLLECFSKGIILVLDRWLVHRWSQRRLHKRFPKRIGFEWFPAYAPELNPVEQVWDRAKYADLANYIPEDVEELCRAVRRSLRHTSCEQKLLVSFFKHTKLEL